jgi:dephospho-CoA kinase
MVSFRFRISSIPRFDADAVVHQMFRENKNVIAAIKSAFPSAVNAEVINRKTLSEIAFSNPEHLKKIEQIIHPQVHTEKIKFLKNSLIKKKKLAVLNIPLLHESGRFGFRKRIGNKIKRELVLSVSVSKIAQENRFLKRAKYESSAKKKLSVIVRRQVTNLFRKKNSDYIIFSGPTKTATRRQVCRALNQLAILS